MKECEFPGCGRRNAGNGLCSGHRAQLNRGWTDLKPLKNIKPKTDPSYRDELGRKRCTTCEEFKDVDNYGKHSSNRDGLQGVCKKCRQFRQRLHNYGISPERYLEMFETQGGSCYLCGTAPDDRFDLCIDHDHSCCPGKKSCGSCVRKLLCRKCNSALGLLQDSPELLRRAANYIESH